MRRCGRLFSERTVCNMNISDRIRELRKKNGLSQEELADRLGVSRQAISKWESEGSLPDIDKVIRLSECFEVSTDYILKGEEPAGGIGPRRAKQIMAALAAVFGITAGVVAGCLNRFRIDEIIVIALLGAVVGGCIGFVVTRLLAQNAKR